MCSILKINKLKDVSQTEAALIRSRQLRQQMEPSRQKITKTEVSTHSRLIAQHNWAGGFPRNPADSKLS